MRFFHTLKKHSIFDAPMLYRFDDDDDGFLYYYDTLGGPRRRSHGTLEEMELFVKSGGAREVPPEEFVLMNPSFFYRPESD